jgi:hypothetical protein
MKLLEIINVGFDVTNQLAIRLFAIVRYWRKLKYNETCTLAIHWLQESL